MSNGIGISKSAVSNEWVHDDNLLNAELIIFKQGYTNIGVSLIILFD
jgi:hypothetical protein